MTNELANTTKNDLSFWTDKTQLAEVKQLFAPNLSDLEFAGFVGMGKALALNPFLREVWAVKYDKSKPAQIFIGRDGYRKVAQRQKDYDYHYADAIYSKDKFRVKNGDIDHEYSFLDRGVLMGAYCVVKRKTSSRPIFCMVKLEDYDKKHSNWSTMKETMIKKVAESQALRAAFQDTFAGTYSEDEIPEISQPKITRTQQLKEKLNTETGEIIDVEGTTHDATSVPESSNSTDDSSNASIDQLTAIADMLKDKNFTKERKEKLLSHYGVTHIEHLTATQANECLDLLERA